MAELAVITKRLDFHLEQVQDFTPTPMTVSTETWYSGYDPYTLEPVFSAKTPREKLAQRQFFFWYKPEERRAIEQELRRIGRPDLIQQLYAGVPSPNHGRNFGNNRRPEFERRQNEEAQPPRDKNRRKGNASASFGGHGKGSDSYSRGNRPNADGNRHGGRNASGSNWKSDSYKPKGNGRKKR